MMGQIFSRPLIGSVLAMTLGLGTGCSHWIELAVHTDAAPPISATVATAARVPLLLETIRVTHNGSSIAPPAILERQVLGAIEATRLFSQHYQSGYNQPAADQARVTVRLSIDNLVEPHAGQAAWRGFVIGASMFAWRHSSPSITTTAPRCRLRWNDGMGRSSNTPPHPMDRPTTICSARTQKSSNS